ncbi:hypothetical protein ACFPM3_29895 [Streptomyces coeruleoprunus]|uniref:Lipoprotein n=1 Tax=Streptomyces coeruleoprunus TaxID=285563 RepID=A0ABV9XPE7_9ACTN
MRATYIRRSAVAATAVSLALLVTACGGEKGKTGGADKPTGGASAPAAAEPAAKVLTAAELESAVIAQGDVKGYKVEKPGADDITKEVSTDKAECKPLADVVSAVALGTPAATVQRKVVQEPSKDIKSPADAFNVSAIMDSLAAYEGKGAEEVVASLRAAGTACAGGFTVTADGEKTKVLKVTEQKVTGGQEAVGFTLLSDMEGTPMPVKIAVVRQGGTLASFSVFNLGVATTGAKDFPLPADLIAAQVAKVAKLG